MSNTDGRREIDGSAADRRRCLELQRRCCWRQKDNVELAPLPAQILSSKKVFIANAGGSDLAYDSFYSEVKSWNRYELLVSKPDDADLVFEIIYAVQNLGTHVWSATSQRSSWLGNREYLSTRYLFAS
jgi:hypothetical protein